MSPPMQQLEAVIAGLEAQRAFLGDAVVDAALLPLRAKLAAPALAPAQGAEPVLRQVSVLFVDIVGSTRFAQGLDPEDIHAVMDGALQRFTTVVQQHQGKVLQYAGDSVLAAFGAEQAREDDAERAVRTGLAVLEQARLLGQEVLQRHGHDGFDVRVGIHTGPVLLGGGVDAESSIRGMTVNIAARMEQTAPHGGLRISHETWRQVRGVFDVEPQPPLQIKGRDEAILTYLVRAAKPRAFRDTRRGIEGVETRLVGREQELSQLVGLFEHVVQRRTLALVTLVGEAGIGKSRLAAEFENGIEWRRGFVWLFRGRAQPQGVQRPYGVLRDLFCWRFEIQDSDSLPQAQAKFAQGLGRVFGDRAEEPIALLGHLIGLDYSKSPHVTALLADGKQLRQRAFHVAAQYFRRLQAAEGGPLLLLLEDLHWADEGSLDFIEHLAAACAGQAVLVLCTTRPALFERRAGWGQSLAAHRRIDLAALALAQSRELADALLNRIDDPPSVLKELLIGGAEGNPFYMEELTLMLIDDGAIRIQGERWSVTPERLLQVRVPTTLTGVLQARIDSLPALEKRALQQASVIGHVFWDEALAQLQAAAPLTLPALCGRELTLARDSSAFDGAREYVFKHHLLHQVAYGGVLKRHRMEHHHRIALWLERRSTGRRGEYLGLIAEHFERGGQADRAVHYWAAAADDALLRHAESAALAHADRALALDGASPHLRRRYQLMRVRHVVFAHRSERPAQALALAEMERLADALDSRRLRSQAATDRSRWHASACAWPEALAAAERALDWAGPAASSEAAEAHGVASDALYRLDRRLPAVEHAQAGLALSRKVGDKKAQSDHLNSLGNLSMLGKALVEAGVSYRESMALKLQIGDRFGAAIVVGNLAILAVQLGQLQEARDWQAQCLQLARETGNRPVEASMHHTLAEVLTAQGEPAAALESAQAGLLIMREIGDRRQEAETLTTCGDAAQALGQWHVAVAHFSAARDLFDEIEMPYWAQMPAAGLAAAWLAAGDGAAALAEVEAIMARLDAGVGAADKCGVLLDCYHVLAAVGDARAEALLVAAQASLQHSLGQLDDAPQREAFLSRAQHQELLRRWATRVPAAARDTAAGKP